MSQQNQLDYLESVSGWNAEKCRQNVDLVLPEIIVKFKESTYIAEGIGFLQVICNNFVPVVSLEEVNDRVFSHISDPANSLVKDVLNKIHLNVEGSLKDTVEELKDVVIDCLQVSTQGSLCVLVVQMDECQLHHKQHMKWLVCISECIEACIHQVQQLATVIPLSCIQSLPACAISILKQMYLHCKESSTLYGNLLDNLGESLSTLFKKGHSLQLTLLSLLDKMCVPNSGLEKHVHVLCEVCNGLFEMCKVVTSLDIKLVVGLWKSISRLCSQNQSLLRDRMDVCPLICYLCEELTFGYAYLFQLCPAASGESLSQGDNKTFMKCLKIQGFQMKVLVALLRDFVDYLGPCEKQVLQLLLYILRCLPPCLSALPVSEGQESDIRSQVANAVPPVLQHLVANRAFRIYLTSGLEDLNQDDHLPLLLLQLNVLDFLPKCDVDVVDCWLSQANHNSDAPSRNLLMAIFQTAEKCHVEMRVPVMLPGPMIEGKPQCQISLYHHVAIHLCGYIGASSARHFVVLESSLMEVVFGRDEMCSLLATDCWCFLARYGSASLCFDHVKLLLQTLQRMFTKSWTKNQRSDATQSKLVFLLRRLIKFLSPEHQTSLVDLCAPEQNLDLWLSLTLTPFCEKVQNRLGKMYASLATTTLDVDSGNADKVFQALDCLSQLLSHSSLVSSCLDHMQQATLLDAVCHLWANQLSCKDDFRQIQGTLIEKLLPATKFFLSAMEASSILQVIQVLLASLNTVAKSITDGTQSALVSAEFMESLGSYQIQPCLERGELMSTIPKLFYRLMTHSHPLVQTKALSAFGHFASHTPHEECIPSCLKSDEGLKARLNNYLNQIPHTFRDEPFNMLDYLRRRSQQRNKNIKGVTEADLSEKNQKNENHEKDGQCSNTTTDKANCDHTDKENSFNPLEVGVDNPPAKRQKMNESETLLSECQESTREIPASDTATSSPTFQNVLRRLNAAADDLESLCSKNGAAPPKDFVDQTKIVISRISDFISEPSCWLDSLA